MQAAWELRHGLIPKPDCSHFVHAVYAQAGFRYQYAASREIFSGAEGFQRVRKAQAGDLVVWRGHIGIVIDPREHTFYSSVLSGFAIESYQSHYWMRRGNPRFYRFVVIDRDITPWLLLSSFTKVVPASDQVLPDLAKVFPASKRRPMLIAEDSRKSSGPELTKNASAKKESAQQKSAQTEPYENENKEAGSVGNAEVPDAVFVTSRPRPSKEEVRTAIARSVDANGELLLRGRTLDSQPSVSVVDRFRVISLSLEGDVGLADVEVNATATLQYGNAVPAPLTTRWHAILSRQEQGWILLLPQDRIYLSRRLAVSNHLMTMSHVATDSRE